MFDRVLFEKESAMNRRRMNLLLVLLLVVLGAALTNSGMAGEKKTVAVAVQVTDAMA